MIIGPMLAGSRHHLNPCMLTAHREEVEVTTLLGSCVSVCLWDATQGFGGMNHYMLPLWNGEGLPTPKYGNVAIEKLIEKMLWLGCQKDHLIAKCFGGASVLGEATGQMMIGARNIVMAEELLAIHRIPMVARDLGGNQGRKVVFNTRTGLALVGRLTPQRHMTR